MKQLKFLVRYEGLDGNEDCEKVFTFEEILQGCHEEDCFNQKTWSAKPQPEYKIEEIVPIDWAGWISVEDDLPGTYYNCLCFDGKEPFLGYLSPHLEWWELFGGQRIVTNWQYLPKPPKNEKE